MINVNKLSKELTIAGIQHSGCNSNGIVWAIDGITEIQAQPAIAAIIAAHDPNPSAVELAQAARKTAAKNNAKLAMAMKTVTPQGAVDYIDSYVTNLSTAKDVLKLMARMLIAMRDEVWPDLPESNGNS